MLQALHKDFISEVSAILKKDPDSASEVFWDHGSTPLICAIRLDCDARIVQLLLDHGADAKATANRGASALAILSSQPQAKGEHLLAKERKQKRKRAVAAMLLSARADPTVCDKSGRCPVDLANDSGNLHLMDLFEGAELSHQEQAEPPCARRKDHDTGMMFVDFWPEIPLRCEDDMVLEFNEDFFVQMPLEVPMQMQSAAKPSTELEWRVTREWALLSTTAGSNKQYL